MNAYRTDRFTLTAVLVLVLVVLTGAVGFRKQLGLGGEDPRAHPPRSLVSGEYETRRAKVSGVQGEAPGRLLKVSKKGASAVFFVAYDAKVRAGTLPVHPDWTVDEVGLDPMWSPEACAQLPSWVIGDRYVMINEAQYDGTEVVEDYVIYDTSEGTFTYLGDPSARTDGKGSHKVLAVSVEGPDVVFYLDIQDRDGPYSSDRDHRHKEAFHNGYVIRRVVSLPDLTFTDYKIPFNKPPLDDYTIQIFGRFPQILLGVNDPTGSTRATAPLRGSGKLVLKPGSYDPSPDAKTRKAFDAASAAIKLESGPHINSINRITPLAHTRDMIYLRINAATRIASLPAEFDLRRSTTTLPLGDDFGSAGFVVGAAA